MSDRTGALWDALWRLLVFIAALGALYNLSEIQGDIAGIRKALDVK